MSPPTAHISPIYSLLFLTLEPLTALAGFTSAYFYPAYHLNTTYPDAPFTFLPHRLPPSVAILLQQLANLYLLFALNEALVLRCAAQPNDRAPPWYRIVGMEWTRVDLRVWRALLAGLLVADAGHLWSVRSLGAGIYGRPGTWNVMAWGNVGVVYVGAVARVCFLLGLGVKKMRKTEMEMEMEGQWGKSDDARKQK